MSKRLWCLVSLALVVPPAWVPAHGQQATAESVMLTGGFADHLQSADGGRIDWTNGYILAEGVGYGQEPNTQNELLAREAARLVALRNALALAQGIRIDASGTVGGLRDGAVRVQGIVRGHEEVEAQWFPDKNPPEAHVVVRVPLWGVKGLASAFCQTHRVRLGQVRAVRRPLVIGRVDVSDFVLVIDCRGVGLSTSLFPVIRDTDGGVLYCVNTLPGEWAGRTPLVRFVESDLPYEQLQAAVGSESPLRFLLAGYQPAAQAVEKQRSAASSTQPTSQPAEKRTKRRAKRRMVFRAAGAAGLEKTEVVLTREDVERIRRSPEGACALRNAHVLIVTDSAAAGTEGRLRPASDGAYALASTPR